MPGIPMNMYVAYDVLWLTQKVGVQTSHIRKTTAKNL